jgi:hypothetical protein
MSTQQIIDLGQLFQKQFGTKPYVINGNGDLSDNAEGFKINGSITTAAEKEFTAKGSLIKETLNGISILLPVRFYDGSELLMHLPYVTVSIRFKQTIIKTPMVERKGSVKEQFSVDDYSMTIKGFLIGDDRKFPETLISQMKDLCERKTAVQIDNALFNIFLTDPELRADEQRRVVILDCDWPEVTGGKHARPFIMQLESDTVFTLELNS